MFDFHSDLKLSSAHFFLKFILVSNATIEIGPFSAQSMLYDLDF